MFVSKNNRCERKRVRVGKKQKVEQLGIEISRMFDLCLTKVFWRTLHDNYRLRHGSTPGKKIKFQISKIDSQKSLKAIQHLK